jgi:hypothetical protein
VRRPDDDDRIREPDLARHHNDALQKRPLTSPQQRLRDTTHPPPRARGEDHNSDLAEA